ncbi:unnamed protein product [Adineta ricciae]|uniref:Uncharacterized protein n=1 Tax=Adineta ricciae TaxID=249248 RepID=A0A816DGP2_ADIRI|nr:unnamed protein product [Adineta ricciae]
MVRIKKKQTATRKRKYRINETNPINSPKRENRSSRIVTKNFEIFVTDFLADPCGLPVELRDYVLVDGSTSLNETSDSCPSNNSQVLKKIFGNNESFDRIIKSSTPLLVEESSKKPGEVEHRIND